MDTEAQAAGSCMSIRQWDCEFTIVKLYRSALLPPVFNGIRERQGETAASIVVVTLAISAARREPKPVARLVVWLVIH